MPNRWGFGQCGKCCAKCVMCFEAIDLFTGNPYQTGTIGGVAITGPSYQVCFSESTQGGFLTPPAVYSPDNPLLITDPTNAAYGIALTLVSATATGGATCPAYAPLCACDPLPPNLVVSSSAPAFGNGQFQGGALTYSKKPAAIAATGITCPIYGYYSAALTATDPLAYNNTFYYWLSCSAGYYQLSALFPNYFNLTPSWLVYPVYLWKTAGASGNTCSPLLFNAGWLNGNESLPSTLLTLTL